MIALGVASVTPGRAGMNSSGATCVVIGAPVASVESQPPAGVSEVGKGPENR